MQTDSNADTLPPTPQAAGGSPAIGAGGSGVEELGEEADERIHTPVTPASPIAEGTPDVARGVQQRLISEAADAAAATQTAMRAGLPTSSSSSGEFLYCMNHLNVLNHRNVLFLAAMSGLPTLIGRTPAPEVLEADTCSIPKKHYGVCIVDGNYGANKPGAREDYAWEKRHWKGGMQNAIESNLCDNWTLCAFLTHTQLPDAMEAWKEAAGENNAGHDLCVWVKSNKVNLAFGNANYCHSYSCSILNQILGSEMMTTTMLEAALQKDDEESVGVKDSGGARLVQTFELYVLLYWTSTGKRSFDLFNYGPKERRPKHIIHPRVMRKVSNPTNIIDHYRYSSL